MSLSPDNRWILFLANDRASVSRVFIARFDEGVLPDEDKWIAISDPALYADKPTWSPDGSVVYFLADHEGRRCIWARKLEPKTKHPSGDVIDIAHFHRPSLRLNSVALSEIRLLCARDKLIFVAGETSGSVWMGRLGALREGGLVETTRRGSSARSTPKRNRRSTGRTGGVWSRSNARRPDLPGVRGL